MLQITILTQLRRLLQPRKASHRWRLWKRFSNSTKSKLIVYKMSVQVLQWNRKPKPGELHNGPRCQLKNWSTLLTTLQHGLVLSLYSDQQLNCEKPLTHGWWLGLGSVSTINYWMKVPISHQSSAARQVQSPSVHILVSSTLGPGNSM